MKKRLLQYLACPSCNSEIRLKSEAKSEGVEIMEGMLECAGCGNQYSIVRGVPRFADLEEIEEDKAATASSFGWEWQHFTQEDERYGEQMLGWLDPVKAEFFKDKVVLDGGCGKGRHMLLAASWGARDVIGIDLSDAVESAFAATRSSDNMHVVQADLCHPPLARVFDYAFTIGVIHHLADPEVGFRALASKLKPGGAFSVWVYGAENNGWIVRLVSPLRERFTSRMNRRGLLHLSKLPTALVYAATKLVFGPLNKFKTGAALARKLFYGEYLSSIADFGWREQHTIVFDHLVAPTAQYVSREQFENWWAGIDAHDTAINWHNKNSWRGFGRTGNTVTEAHLIASTKKTKPDPMTTPLPKEMMQHTYPILFEVEESHWWYIGRRRIIASFVEGICRRLENRRPRILDVGCGTGANLVLLSRFGEAEGVDISPDALSFCRERGLENVRLGAAETLPYEDGRFDVVTAFDVVEHMDDDIAGLREMRRVLKPDGRLLLFVPTFMFLWGVQDEVSNHRRRYRLPELRRVVRQAGFEIERTTYANITFFAPILLVRKLMRLTGIRTATENSINIPILNRVLGHILGSERAVLRYMNLPFGVSGLCVARRVEE